MGHKHKNTNGGEAKIVAVPKCTVGKKWGEDQREETVSCSLVSEVIIYLDLMPKQKILTLMEEYEAREWLGYLVGKIDEDGDLIASDLVIPPHTESAYASAEAEPFHIPEHCIGVIHSHHKMGAFHSGTDATHVDRNFPVSITVAKGSDGIVFDAKSALKTPCGKAVHGDATVKYLQPAFVFEKEEWLKTAKENIDKGVTKVTYVNPQRNYLGGYVGQDWTKWRNTYSPKTAPPSLDRQEITKEASKEEEGRQGEGVNPDWGKINGAKPIITTKMIERLGSKLFEGYNVVLSRSQLEEMLQKNPDCYQEGVELPIPEAWSI